MTDKPSSEEKNFSNSAVFRDLLENPLKNADLDDVVAKYDDVNTLIQFFIKSKISHYTLDIC